MKKYIIKNCNSFRKHATLYQCQNENKKYLYCKDCNDCLLKKIVEKCKEHLLKDCPCGDDILELLDIEEIE